MSMGLMQFLAVSPCFSWGKDETSRYVVPAKNPLPKFGLAGGSGRRPSSGHTSGQGSRPEPSLPGGEVGERVGAGNAAASGQAPRRQDRLESEVEAAGGARVVTRNLFKPAPIQAELALDSVIVVRNDLTDADLEVVPSEVEAATSSGTSSTEAPTPVGTSGGSGWSRLAAQFLQSSPRGG
jgi:hypothetical protein